MISSDEAGQKYINMIKWRLNNANKNFLAIICGSTGSGKSYSALSIAEQISGRVIVVFSPIEFMERLTDGTVGKSDTIIFDEAGVGMSSRQWQSVSNKLLGSILQTFRSMNVCVIFTTPHLGFLDLQARKLLHCYMETARVDYKASLAYLRVYDIEVNSMYDKIYYKHPKIKDENGMVFGLSHLAVKKPSADIIKMYEARKLEYVTNLNKKALAEMKGEGKPVSKFNTRIPDKDRIVEEIVSNPKEFLRKKYNGKSPNADIDPEAIMAKYNIGMQTARLVKKQAEMGLGIGFALRG